MVHCLVLLISGSDVLHHGELYPGLGWIFRQSLWSFLRKLRCRLVVHAFEHILNLSFVAKSEWTRATNHLLLIIWSQIHNRNVTTKESPLGWTDIESLILEYVLRNPFRRSEVIELHWRLRMLHSCRGYCAFDLGGIPISYRVISDLLRKVILGSVLLNLKWVYQHLFCKGRDSLIMSVCKFVRAL